MFLYESDYFVDLADVKPIVCSQLHRVKPDLCFVTRCLNVNMRRFLAFVAEKVKSVSADTQDSWHAGVYFDRLML